MIFFQVDEGILDEMWFFTNFKCTKVTSCFLWGSVSELLDVSCFNGHEKRKKHDQGLALILEIQRELSLQVWFSRYILALDSFCQER